MADASRDGRGERGSVLMLMPAAVLVFIVLGAIAVDFGVAFLAERELANAAAAAANDAATQAIDLDRFYADGTVELDQGVAAGVADRSVAARAMDWLEEIEPAAVAVGDGPSVTVVLRARVRTIFARALPRGPDTMVVEATATATAERR